MLIRALLASIALGSAGAVHAQDALSRPAYPYGTGPMVLYDTAHWNPSLKEGRYQAVAELLRADGYQLVAGRVGSDPHELASYRVVVIVTPYAANPRGDRIAAQAPAFSGSEADMLAAWVRRGGSLLLVVGHQPSGAANAQLARRFSVDLRNSTTMDSTPANNWVEGDRGCLGCLKFTLENGLISAHAIMQGRDSTERVHSVISAAGSSLGVADEGELLLLLGPASYDVNAAATTVVAFGRGQAVAREHGTGRVVVLGDGSILAGSVYGPENPRFRRWWPRDPENTQYTLNIMHWLSGLLE